MEEIGALAGLAPATWPDDIIDTIVAQVAAAAGFIRADQLKALKICALVSKIFYFPARRRFFATLEFKIDDSAQARAARLCQVLKTNSAIIDEIKSFKLLLDLKSSVAAKVFSTKVALVDPKLLRIFWAENSIYRLLTWISHAKLQKLTIYSNPHSFNMNNMCISSKSLLLAIRSIRSLHSLSIVGVANIPVSLVVGSVGHDHLRHLLLCGSTLQKSSAAAIPQHEPSFNPLSKVEALEWCCTLYSDLSRVLWPALADPSCKATIPFPHLRRYTATLRSNAEANTTIWNVILSTAQTLEDLNIRDVITAGKYKSFVGLFSLDRLTALRRLMLSPHFPLAPDDCQLKLNTVVELLSSATVPTTVESLILDFHIRMEVWDRIDSAAFKTAEWEWATLDSILTGSMFQNLRALSFRFNSISRYSQIDISEISLAKERNALRALLESVIPHIMVDSHISVDVDFTARSPSDMPIRCPHHCNASNL